MLSPEHLEITAHSLTAILGVWLGLTVATRSHAPAARVFGLLGLALAAWSSSVIIERLAASIPAVQFFHGIEELAAAVIVPATAHFALVIATDGRPPPRASAAIAIAYAANILFAVPGVLNPGAPIAIAPPHLDPGGVVGTGLGWAWIGTRLVTLLAASWWLLRGYRRERADRPRRRQLALTLATVAVGALGGIIRIFSVVGPSDPWIGVSLVTVSMVLAASVVFSGGLFFAPDVAGRAFWTSLAAGVGLFLAVGALLALDALSRRVLGLDLPLPTLLALVVAVAVYEPVVDWGRSALGARGQPTVARHRLLRALGPTGLATQPANAGVQPALTRVAQTLDLAGAAVIRSDGTVAATEGRLPDVRTDPAFTLVASHEVVGELRVARSPSGPELSTDDEQVLRLSAAYVAAALRTGRHEDEQAEALGELTEERANVELTATRLHDALVRRAAGIPGLRIRALGTLTVVRGATPIERWGGEKAGSRQAEGLFAFLFDRGERGVQKDEALELIWPDIDVDRADLAFHRTMGGLRRTLAPGGGNGKDTIRFHNDRYRLDPGLVAWSDVQAFLAHLDEARAMADPAERLRVLEGGRALYRGEYLDDCPFYGDGAQVEERRAVLRGRYIDLLVALGDGYETAGDRPSAAAAFRDALAAADEDCPPATAGLERLARRA